ncbi:MAG: YggT family protein, partial [Gammaproteobacteria bacterium]|nr:YggT family protein [Gammaproteobacteria bacterium]
MLTEILLSSLQILTSFYLTIVLLRFLLQLARADFYNPITQFVVRATNPLLVPLRRVIPGWGGIDGASLVLAILIQTLVFVFILLALGQGFAINILTLLAWSVVTVLGLIVKIYFWSLLAVIILSWIAPTNPHPAI